MDHFTSGIQSFKFGCTVRGKHGDLDIRCHHFVHRAAYVCLCNDKCNVVGTRVKSEHIQWIGTYLTTSLIFQLLIICHTTQFV